LKNKISIRHLSAKPVKGTRYVYEKFELKIDLMSKIPCFFPLPWHFMYGKALGARHSQNEHPSAPH
jgi:hypothetical protein